MFHLQFANTLVIFHSQSFSVISLCPPVASDCLRPGQDWQRHERWIIVASPLPNVLRTLRAICPGLDSRLEVKKLSAAADRKHHERSSGPVKDGEWPNAQKLKSQRESIRYKKDSFLSSEQSLFSKTRIIPRSVKNQKISTWVSKNLLLLLSYDNN